MSHDFTQNWHWPQWFIIGYLFLNYSVTIHYHDKPKVHTSGPKQGQPYTFNAFNTLIRSVILIAVLDAGGFFQ
jgi:hypothetical protein